MTKVTAPDRYIEKVVSEFADECDATWESRKKLWQTVVIIYEFSADPEHWIDAVTDIAANAGMKHRDIVATLVSGLKHARKSGYVA